LRVCEEEKEKRSQDQPRKSTQKAKEGTQGGATKGNGQSKGHMCGDSRNKLEKKQ